MKNISKLIAGILTGCMILSATPVPSIAAGFDSKPQTISFAQKGVRLNIYSLTMYEGGTFTFKATSSGQVSWNSSDASVASVDSAGKVTAKKAGSTIVTASCNGSSASAKVTVKAKKKSATDGKYLDASAAYTELNNFRTTSGVWYWRSDNKTKAYFNKKGCTTLSGLKKSSELENVAKIRAKEAAEKFSHTRPNGSSWSTAFPSGYTAKAENLALLTSSSGQNVIVSWEEADKSYSGQGHRRAMLSSRYTHVGIACYEKDGKYYWAMALGKK